MKNIENKNIFSPGRLLFMLLIAILVIEVTVFSLLNYIRPPFKLQALVNSILLVVVLAPVLYYLVNRAIPEHIKNNQISFMEIRKSCEMFRLSLENSSENVFVLASDGTIQHKFPAMEGSLGYKAEELIGTKIFDYVHPDDLKMVTTVFTGNPDVHQITPTIEFRLREKSGKWRYLEAKGNNLLSNPIIKGIIINSRDITDIKRREQDFHKFFHAVEQSPSSVVITDDKGRIEYINPKYTELTGYTLEEIKGKNPRILKSGKVPMETYDQLWKTITSGKDWRGELLNKKKNGDLFWETASISSIKNEEGRITNFIGVKEDVTKRKEAEEKVKYMIYHDNLTGLPNRLLFNDRLEVALAQAKRANFIVSVMFMDLDGFKSINDTLGHTAGDMLLKDIARRLKTCLRSGDTACRFGGDEFTFIFSGVDHIQRVCKIAEKILSLVRQPWVFDGKEHVVSPSIGISLYPNDADEAEELINKADAAMYLVKESGKNGYKFYSSLLQK